MDLLLMLIRERQKTLDDDKKKTFGPPTVYTRWSEWYSRNAEAVLCRTGWSVGSDFIPFLSQISNMHSSGAGLFCSISYHGDVPWYQVNHLHDTNSEF